jgi:protease-4
MKKFLLGVLVGLLLAGTACVVIFFATVRFGERKPDLPASGVLVLNLEGAIPEAPPAEAPLPGLAAGSPLTVAEVWGLLHSAERDKRIQAVLVEVKGLRAGWGKLEEIRGAIERVKKAGKPVWARLEAPGLREYYVASAADKIYATPEDLLDLKGLRIDATYFRGTLDKLGVQVEIEHAGKYKDAGDAFTRTSMSAETRESLGAILDGLYGHILEVLGKARQKSPAQMRALLDKGPFLAPAAKRDGLVDDLIYRDQVEERLRAHLKAERLNRIRARDYWRWGAVLGRGARRNRIALLTAQGDIVRGQAAGLFGEETAVSPARLAKQIRLVAEDPSVRGVILRVDSPGGDAVASDEMLRDLRELARKKPMVVSFSDVAASGGYYIAMTGDPVLAYPGTITGSIGVIYGKANLKGLYDKLGLSRETLKRGKFADIDSDVTQLTPEARLKLQEGVRAIYEGFLSRVAEGRKKPVAEIAPFAEGRAWLALDARKNGLVDEIGGLDAAVGKLRARLGLDPDDAIQLAPYPGRRSWLDLLLSYDPQAGTGALDAALGTAADRWGLAPWLNGGMLKVMPYRLEFR